VDSHYLHTKGLNVTATDFCDEFVDIVKDRFPEIHAHKMDMTRPDLSGESFDGIYAFASLIHLPRELASGTLQGLRKLLKKEGVLFMTLIDSSIHREYVIPNWGNQENNPMLFTCWRQDEIELLLKSAGFGKIEFHNIGSALYENLPRLVERGVTNYQILAFI
jgi:2-polyprenyl-3-methyl-5-hydroxy-6-metoxy-1,4-benzoquinol methylase